jgi:hypothetical protein
VAEETWYGPGDAWPGHPKKHFRDALDYARAAGWHLREIKGHSFSRVYCCRDPEQCCMYLVFSSGRGGESAARQLVKDVDACRHTRRTELDALEQWVHDISKRLDSVGRMLAAAADCVTADAHADAAYDLLGHIDDAINDIDELLAVAEQASEHATEVLTDAWTVVHDEVGSIDFPTKTRIVVEHVHAQLAETEKELAAPPAGPIHELDALRARARGMRQELDGLRAQLPDSPQDVM